MTAFVDNTNFIITIFVFLYTLDRCNIKRTIVVNIHNIYTSVSATPARLLSSLLIIFGNGIWSKLFIKRNAIFYGIYSDEIEKVSVPRPGIEKYGNTIV